MNTRLLRKLRREASEHFRFTIIGNNFDTFTFVKSHDKIVHVILHTGLDFLNTELPFQCDTIITNPPYALADEFVKHAMGILPRGGRYFALMNLSYLAGQKRFKEIYNNGYLHAIHVYPHRIHCYKNNENTGHSSPVNYAWFEYVKHPTLECKWRRISFPPVIYWIEK